MKFSIFCAVAMLFIQPVTCDEAPKNNTPQSQRELLDDETDIWYWNDYEPSTIDNPTTPLIREDALDQNFKQKEQAKPNT